MVNSFYTPSGTPGTGTFGASAPVRTEFGSVAAGFDKMPALTASTAVVVNGAGTALTNTVGTLALAGNFSTAGAFTTTGAFSTTLVAGANVSLTLPLVNGTLATLAGTETLSNKTFVAPILGTPGSGNLINCTGLPLTGVTGTLPVANGGTGVTSSTGTGSVVLSASPTLTGTLTSAAANFSGNVGISNSTLNLSLNRAAGGPLQFIDLGSGGKTWQMGVGAGNTNATLNLYDVTDGVFAFAINTSGQVNFPNSLIYGGVTLTNAVTGTGSMVLSASPTLTGTMLAAAATFSGVVTHSSTTTLSGALTYGGVTLTNAVTGTGSMVLSASPTITSPTISGSAKTTDGAFYYTPFNGVTDTGLTRAGIQLDGTNQGVNAYTANTYRGGWLSTGVFTLTSGQVNLQGATSGSVTLAVTAIAGSNTITVPAATGTMTVLGNTTTGSGGSIVLGTGPTIASPAITGTVTGGATYNSPTLVTPVLGTPSSGTLTSCTGLPAASVVAGALANGMTATTQSAADNSTKLASTAYADRVMTNMVVRVQTFAASGTYTPHPKMIYCIIEAVGSGGGGGSCANTGASVGAAAAGGGGGSYAFKIASAATIGASQVVTVDPGGSGGFAGGGGSNGGDTSVGTLCIGKGGSGGGGSAGSGVSIGGAGGVSGTGDFSIIGQNGSNGGSITNGLPPGGDGGGTALGFGARGPCSQTVAVGNAANPNTGGGGSGGMSYNASGAASGGSSGSGFVKITEYCSA